MVFLDAVYNHFGPAGNYLHAYAKTFFTRASSDALGRRHQLRRRDQRQGLCATTSSRTRSTGWKNTISTASASTRSTPFWTIRPSTSSASSPRPSAPGYPAGTSISSSRTRPTRPAGSNATIRPSRSSTRRNGADDLHHCWHVLLTGEDAGYYVSFADKPVEHLARCLAEGFAYQGEPFPSLDNHPRGEPSSHLPPSAFVTFLQNHDQVGNRALGERLSALSDPDKLSLARAGFLLAPQIPMLWMGGGMVGHDAVPVLRRFRAGRGAQQGRARGAPSRVQELRRLRRTTRRSSPIPRRNRPSSIRSSTGPSRSGQPHRGVWADTRNLLQIRHQSVVPLTKTQYLGADVTRPSPDSLDVTWRYAGGTLRFVANFGADPLAVDSHGGQVIWSNGHTGSEIELPTWTGIVLTGAAR